MLRLLYDSVFGCRHRRMTRPITPVSKPGVPSGETYVVCLECGKQFAYDWDHMRLGEPIDPSSDAGVVGSDVVKPGKSKLKYALIASAIPLGIVIGKAVLNKRRAASGASHGAELELDHDPAMGRYVRLPNGGPGARFRVGDLVRHIQDSGRDYIIQGRVDCALADHPKPQSLDYWLRERFARNKDVKQATDDLVEALVASGIFEEVPDLKCPDTGDECRAVRLTARVRA